MVEEDEGDEAAKVPRFHKSSRVAITVKKGPRVLMPGDSVNPSPPPESPDRDPRSSNSGELHNKSCDKGSLEESCHPTATAGTARVGSAYGSDDTRATTRWGEIGGARQTLTNRAVHEKRGTTEADTLLVKPVAPRKPPLPNAGEVQTIEENALFPCASVVKEEGGKARAEVEYSKDSQLLDLMGQAQFFERRQCINIRKAGCARFDQNSFNVGSIYKSFSILDQNPKKSGTLKRQKWSKRIRSWNCWFFPWGLKKRNNGIPVDGCTRLSQRRHDASDYGTQEN